MTTTNTPLIPTVLRPDYNPDTTPSLRERLHLPEQYPREQILIDACYEVHHAPNFASYHQLTSRPWLWPGYLPIGSVTLLEGPARSGKTRLALDLAARVSAGLPMPDGSPTIQGNVIYVSCVDDPVTVLNPALVHSGGSTQGIFHLNTLLSSLPKHGPVKRGFDGSQKHLVHLSNLINTSNARLIVIDALNTTLGLRAGNRGCDLVEVLSKLAQLASYFSLSVLLIRTCAPKRDRSLLSPLDKSPYPTAICKQALFLGPDPLDASRRVLSSAFSIDAAPFSQSFRLTGDPVADPASTVQWEGAHTLDYTELFTAYHNSVPPTSAIQSGAYDLLAQYYPEPLGAKEMAPILNAAPNSVTRALTEMHKTGRLTRVSKGLYTLTYAPPTPPTPADTTTTLSSDVLPTTPTPPTPADTTTTPSSDVLPTTPPTTDDTITTPPTPASLVSHPSQSSHPSLLSQSSLPSSQTDTSLNSSQSSHPSQSSQSSQSSLVIASSLTPSSPAGIPYMPSSPTIKPDPSLFKLVALVIFITIITIITEPEQVPHALIFAYQTRHISHIITIITFIIFVTIITIGGHSLRVSGKPCLTHKKSPSLIHSQSRLSFHSIISSSLERVLCQNLTLTQVIDKNNA